MKYTSLLILASLTVCNLPVSRGQGIPEDETGGDRTTIDDIILQRAESLLLHSILKKIEDADVSNEGYSSQPEWMTKRQHPGKRYDDLERLQYPGRRDEDEDEDYTDVQKRQHPGKREDEMDSFMDFQKRQHPGKRSMLEQISENPSLLSDLSKRQHPGRRFLMKYSKRQHPGKRNVEEDGEAEVLQDFEKRQHPGKRYLDNTSTDLGANSPCDMLDPTSCSKANLLLELLDNVTKSRGEEKRQHPGKRLAPEEDLVVQE
ncbi:pro-thyrotropin-releasing hormone [Aplochiton taeniatus]